MFRALIYIIVFLSGAALMSLEMAGFRLAQPEFGSDIIVWGSLIAVFLLGLAVGAFVGGRMADKKARLSILGIIILVAGATVVFMPLYSDGVFDAFYPSDAIDFSEALTADAGGAGTITIVEPPDLRWPTLGAGAVLFLIPSILIGMITPYSARLLIRNLPKLGRGVGAISALSTVGSIVGTLMTSFFFIQWVGTRSLITINGVVLIGIGLIAIVGQLVLKPSDPTELVADTATEAGPA